MSNNCTHFTQPSPAPSDPPSSISITPQIPSKSSSVPSFSTILYKLIPNLSYSELKLSLYYADTLNKQSKSIQSLDITDFCQKTNTSRQSAYSALKTLQDKYLIPINVKFTNTFQITKKRTKEDSGVFKFTFKRKD